ncbi:MAG TPA: ABC transporter transmembrane domain-containing protein, partial [Candidatus Polarisedimenticolaceae bacterium]|nr:ABC transporter transmembrane domain-containing protein [Candidatus Polarisedimenticolaceae bacterium]
MTDDDVLGRAYDARLMRRLAAYARPHRGLVALSLGLLFALSAVQLVQPWLIKLAIDQGIAARRLQGLALPAGLFLLALVAEFLLRYAQLYVLERAGQNIVFDLRDALFSHLQRLPAAFFDRNPVGRLVTRLTSDVDALQEAFTSGVVLVLADLAKLAGIVAILVWMDWRMALVTFALLPPLVALTWVFRLRLREAYRRVRLLVARLNAFLQEHVSGMRVVQLFGQERATAEHFVAINGEHRDAQIVGVRYDAVFSAVTELTGALALAAILWSGGVRILSGAITFGTLVAFIEYAGRFFGPLQELSQRYTVMQAAMAAAERIFRLLDTPAAELPRAPRAADRREVRGEIVFDDVSFAYDGEPVLHEVSFRIRPGESVGVVGWTGSGKSTLIRLLVRLYEPQRGRILLDGVDVREWELRELRRTIGVVLQDPFLFVGTVESNISLGDPEVGAADVRRAAAAVGVDRLVARLPQG